MPAIKRSRDDMDEGARKKLKHDRSEVSPVRNIIDLSSDAPDAPSIAPSAPPLPNDESAKALRVLHTDFDALRSLVTCKICERLLYEPYVLSCGHTYCYSCLCTWFQGKHKKTCPGCREVIRHMPAPSYVIKEMAAVFIARPELIPEGETLEMHVQWQQEESDIVQVDRNNEDPRTGGLFKGSFADHRQRIGPIFDREDNIQRCPGCNWELEDGECNSCGYRIYDEFEVGSNDEISDDVSDELDSDEVDGDDFDAVDADFGHLAPFNVDMFGAGPPEDLYRQLQRGHRYGPGMHAGTDEEEEDEDEEDDEGGSLDGFIDDGHDDTIHTIQTDSGSEDAPSSSVQSAPRVRRRRRVISDDEDEDNEDDATPAHARPAASYDEEDDDSDPEIVAVRPAVRRPGQPLTIVDSDDESLDSGSEGDSEDDIVDGQDGSSSRQYSDDEEGDIGVQDITAGGWGFSSLENSEQSDQSGQSEQSDNDRGSIDEGSDGDDGEDFTWPGRAHEFIDTRTLRRPRPAFPSARLHPDIASRAPRRLTVARFAPHLQNSFVLPTGTRDLHTHLPVANHSTRSVPGGPSLGNSTLNAAGNDRVSHGLRQSVPKRGQFTAASYQESDADDAGSSDTLTPIQDQQQPHRWRVPDLETASSRSTVVDRDRQTLLPITFNVMLDHQRRQRARSSAFNASDVTARPSSEHQTSLGLQVPRGQLSYDSDLHAATHRHRNTGTGQPAFGRGSSAGEFKHRGRGRVVDLVSSEDEY